MFFYMNGVIFVIFCFFFCRSVFFKGEIIIFEVGGGVLLIGMDVIWVNMLSMMLLLVFMM